MSNLGNEASKFLTPMQEAIYRLHFRALDEGRSVTPTEIRFALQAETTAARLEGSEKSRALKVGQFVTDKVGENLDV